MTLNSAQIKEAKEWLSDCIFADVEPEEIAEMSDDVIVRAVARHYDGGIESFVQSYNAQFSGMLN